MTSVSNKGLPGSAKGGDTRHRVDCQICGSPTIPGLDLGHQPVSDLILSPAQLNQPETFYPLQLYYCRTCWLTQLGYSVNPKVVFKNFPFVSGTTQTATRHLQSLPKQLVEMLSLNRRSFAIDIGSNDGTLLKGYVPHGVKFLGVDPAGDPVRIANAQGIETLHRFFNAETAEEVLDHYGKAEAITACGVFAHIADLVGVMKGVKRLLVKRGIFATDSQYWLDMVLRRHYDNIFHQHLRYYSLKPLIHLYRQYDMEVFDVERSEVYGGSIRVFGGHSGAFPISPRVAELVALEEQQKLYNAGTQERFAREVRQRKRKLFDAVYKLSSAGKKVIGIGAPAKAATVCNYCRLGPDQVEYITEVNPLRIGKFLPGVHVPILSEEYMFQDSPPADAGILFAWNYYDEIVPKLRQRGFKGKVLLP
ncbi:MAG: class I SAM-dependent methyltransferase [Acidobacteria bacterium]|nr:class I SAM-dependent methyltransferase [Acidobacteriota bacterium]MBI3658098.1 class I SAM-dependent methyltransferase [Acidobacteriota bacterium]